MLQLLPIFAILLTAPRLSYWDITSHRLPNRITLPLIGFSLLAVMASWDGLRIITALAIAIATFLIGWALSHLNTLGMGDVKLLTAMALALGFYSWASYLFGLFIGLLVATIFSVVQIFRERLSKNSSIALGPYLLFGFAVATIQPIAMVLFTAEA